MPELLLEIGTEEIPPVELAPLAEHLRARAEAALRESLLNYESLRVLYTPRRLVLHVRGLADRQEDQEEEVLGPSVKVGIAPDGSPTPAAVGFARSQGVAVEELGRKQTEKGEYLFVRRRIPGRPTAELLGELLPKLIRELPAGETMRWDESGLYFVRPIRWLLCLLDDQVIDFTLGSLRSSRWTHLHRFSSPPKVEIRDPGDYFRKLREDLVVLDPAERRERIEKGLERLARKVGGRPLLPEDFLQFLVDLIEHPTPILGEFDPRFLKLPQEVLFTTMREEGHFVPVVDGDGRALPYFIGLRDGPSSSSSEELIKRGYERVLRAKLTDSEYFFQADRRCSLADYVPRLREVIYQEKLGTIWDKVERIRALAAEVARRAGFTHLEEIDRAAYLCKADLVTQMVGEFPSLEGVIGGIYAALDHEPELVARGIREHYLPRARGDALPESEPGIAISLADKLDTVIGSLLIGEEPTGSRDPYGLRRKANGIIRIALGRELDLDFYELVCDMEHLYDFLGPSKVRPITAVVDFLNERLYQILLQEHGLDYDILEATTSVGEGNFWRVLLKSQALAEIRSGAEQKLSELVIAFSRARNIVAKAQASGEAPEGTGFSFDPELFEEEAERELWRAYLEAKRRIEALEPARRYGEILQELLRLKAPIDRYFDEVLVMAPSPGLRANRLGFLGKLVELFFTIGDLSKLVVAKD